MDNKAAWEKVAVLLEHPEIYGRETPIAMCLQELQSRVGELERWVEELLDHYHRTPELLERTSDPIYPMPTKSET